MLGKSLHNQWLSVGLFSLTLSTGFLSACGGGSDAPQPVNRTEFSTPDRQILAGPWPQNLTYLLVADQQHWNQIWTERQAHLACTPTTQLPACTQATAPTVDFSRYHVIGLNFNQSCRFSKSSDYTRVTEKEGVRTVEFDVTCILPGQAPYTDYASDFFLLPRGTVNYLFQPSGV